MKRTRPTLATFKAFLRRNEGRLYVEQCSTFDGMVDGVRTIAGHTLKPAKPTTDWPEHTLGLEGLWLVGGSRDYFEEWQRGSFVGFHVYNSCGSCNVAVNIEEPAANA